MLYLICFCLGLIAAILVPTPSKMHEKDYRGIPVHKVVNVETAMKHYLSFTDHVVLINDDLYIYQDQIYGFVTNYDAILFNQRTKPNYISKDRF